MIDATAIILTKNEEKNIVDCFCRLAYNIDDRKTVRCADTLKI